MHRCYLKLGDWQTALEGYSEKSIPQILQYYAAATENDRNCYKVHLEFFVKNGFAAANFLVMPH